MNNTLAFAGLLAVLPACISDSQADKHAAAADPNANPEETSRPDVTAPPQARQRKGLHMNIDRATRENRDFRRVLYTGRHLQLVLMSLKPGEEIGSEAHSTHDQFFRVEAGTGQCVINGHRYTLTAGDVVVAPAGSTHNVTNTSTTKPLQLYTLYAPPQHQDGIVRATKQAASRSEASFNGKTTE